MQPSPCLRASLPPLLVVFVVSLVAFASASSVLHGPVNGGSSLPASDRVIMEEDDPLFLSPPLESAGLGHWNNRWMVSPPFGWSIRERVPRSLSLHLIFALKHSNVGLLEEKLLSISDPLSPDYGLWLTLDQVTALTAPRRKDVELVKRFLLQHAGDRVELEESGGGAFVRAVVSAEEAEKMLQCRFHRFEHHTGFNLVRSVTHYSLPKEVADVVDFVGGVKHFPRMQQKQQKSDHTKLVQTADSENAAPQAFFVTPSVLRQQYNVGETVGVTPKNKQSVVQFIGQYYSSYNLQEFFLVFYGRAYGEKPKTIGYDGYLPGMEASLDIEYIMAMGALIETWFWSNPDTPSFNEAPFLNWLYDMGNRSDVPYVNSVSYGEDENSLTRAYVKRVNEEFMKQASRGISILFASGDSGVGTETGNCKTFVPDYPASSPWVTAVGGTQLSFSNNEEANSISGGGFSNYAPRPSWQDEAVKAYIGSANLPPSDRWNASGRAYPDIAALSANFVVVMDLVPIPGVAGTSCAAPTAAGIISLLNDLRFQAGKPQLGFLNPFIYQTATKYPEAFNDITSGSNPGCGTSGFPATKGWDPVTGWGSPDYAELAKIVSTLP